MDKRKTFRLVLCKVTNTSLCSANFAHRRVAISKTARNARRLARASVSLVRQKPSLDLEFSEAFLLLLFFVQTKKSKKMIDKRYLSRTKTSSNYKFMKPLWLLVLFTALLSACAGTTTLSPTDSTISSQLAAKPLSDSITITINALNLSEDMSKTLSTKNDELLIFIYENKEDGSLDAPLVYQTMLLDLKHRKKHFTWKKDSSLKGKDLLFIMLEQDYETPIEQLDPIIRVQHQHIIAAFKKRDYRSLRTYLGTEDFLGYKKLLNFSTDEPYSFTITGVYKLDLYEYEITIGNE